MTERLTYPEIKARYAPEWVLIGDVEVDETLEVVSGDVLCHSLDRDDIDLAMMAMRPTPFALRFLGVVPDDFVLML